jgi:multiple sugar transport system substrate-binding protein
MTRAGVGCSLLAVLLLAGCARDADDPITLRFWAMGREGEVVQELVREFEAATPGIRVEVQKIPWSAAHEKLLTAYVGRATPDLAQLGNTWVPEFEALEALVALDDRVLASAVVHEADHFPGIWDTNVIDGRLYGVPWYVDTRVLFYRSDLLARAGHPTPPTTWRQWRAVLADVTASGNPGSYGILLPVNEWAQPVILGLQAGSPLLRDNATYGAFSEPAFARAFTFYVDLFASGLAPPVGNNEVANLFQEFARGTFAMYISGPWNLGEFKRRLPAELQDSWSTAPMPAPDDSASAPGASLAGGSSLVVFRRSRHADAAWQLIEFLSRPEQQRRFYELTGDLPAHRAAWAHPALAGDLRADAFRQQLEHVVPTPKVPEWEQVTERIWVRAEQVVRGAATIDEALAGLDADVDRILAKRRWLLDHAAGAREAEVDR